MDFWRLRQGAKRKCFSIFYRYAVVLKLNEFKKKGDNKDRQGWFEGRVHGRNLNVRDLARAPSANFSVRYSKLLTVGVKKKKIIPLCHVAHELTSRTYGEKKWWVVIVEDQ